MIRQIVHNLFLALLLIHSSSILAAANDRKDFSHWLIQHEGRVKPLDTFARTHLLSFHHKSSIDKRDAIDWLKDLLLNPDDAYKETVFKIRNPEILSALGIDPSPDSRYSFSELSAAMNNILEQLHAIHAKPREDRSLVEDQLAELYVSNIRYLELSRSLTGLIPEFVIENESLAHAFNLEPDEKVSYLHFVLHKEVMRGKIGNLNNKDEASFSDEDKAVVQLVTALNQRLRDQPTRSLAIIPPESLSIDEKWFSPWELMDGRDLTGYQIEQLQLLAQSVSKLQNQEATAFNASLLDTPADLEVFYNRADFFYKSLYCYILSFVALGFSWILYRKILWRTSCALMGLGALLHLTGVFLRVVIMERPPVTTLYESIIFVGLITVTLGLAFEWIRKNGLGLLIASLSGSLLHFIGFSYAAEGDTLGMLVAVLNSNFWLATHVVTIMFGYGTTIVASIAGHAYLLMRIARPSATTQLKNIYQASIGLALVALFFTTLGTILGGIWADQSWGRFWGWDPKENGAMLIVIILLALIHGRISGQLKELGFSVGLVLANIVVALAWFGVNLLNVGLHSYGFTENILANLSLFCGLELLFAIVCLILVKLGRTYSPLAKPR